MNSLKKKFAVSNEKMAVITGGWTCWTRAGKTFTLLASIKAEDLLDQFESGDHSELAGCSQ